MPHPTVNPFLWFEPGQAELAAGFYVALFEDAEILTIRHLPAGDFECLLIEIRLGAMTYTLMGAPGAPAPSSAFSFSVICQTQAEIDHLWDNLSVGGEPMACGWIKDRFGVSWQITPARMQELTDQGTRAQRVAVMEAMMDMVKFDIAGLETAFAAAATPG